MYSHAALDRSPGEQLVHSPNPTSIGGSLLREWAAIFFFLALGAGAFAFTGIAEGATEIAKILFYIFLAMFVVLLIAGIAIGRKIRRL
jgi:uncharacterized membrane protein YtjA (UPF0391 family)